MSAYLQFRFIENMLVSYMYSQATAVGLGLFFCNVHVPCQPVNILFFRQVIESCCLHAACSCKNTVPLKK